MKKDNKIEKDKEQTEYSYIGSGGIKFGGAARVILFIKFYKKNIWLLIVSLLVIVLLSVIGFFVKPFWGFIINLVVGVGALFGISSWKIPYIIEKTSS